MNKKTYTRNNNPTLGALDIQILLFKIFIFIYLYTYIFLNIYKNTFNDLFLNYSLYTVVIKYFVFYTRLTWRIKIMP